MSELLEIEQARYPAPVDKRIVSELRQILRPLLFERAYSRRAPSERGQRFNPGGFYEIKTRPEAPRVKKDVLRIAGTPNELELILCFDRSGSMEDDGKTKVAVQIAATLYSALSTTPKARVQLLAFDDVPHLIKGKAPLSPDTALRRIAHGVQANPIGGTNLPLALKECIGLADRNPSHRKIILILTDGDTSGSCDPEELVSYARSRSIDVVCVGVQGSDPYALEQVFGKGNAIYVDRIRRLSEEMKRIVMRRC